MIAFAPMEKKDTQKTREEIFAEKADNYEDCFSTTCPLTPNVERYVRQNLKNNGWPEEPRFLDYVEDYLWQQMVFFCPQRLLIVFKVRARIIIN